MQDTFHDGLTAEALRPLYTRRDGPGVLRVVAQVAGAVGSGLVLMRAEDGAAFGVALAVHSVFQLSFFGALHECAHRTAFRSRWLNELVAWVAAVPQLMAPQLMRVFHFEHHRHTHDLERDPELAGLEFMADWPRGLLGVGTASGVPILFARLGMTLTCALGAPGVLARRVVPYLRPKDRLGVAAASLALVLLHVGLAALAWRLEPRALRLYLAVPLSHALLALYTTCEHRGLPCEGSVLARTRSFAAGPLIRWVFWNMPYHAEHHAYPAVPFHALPALHAELAPRILHRTPGPLGLYLRRGAPAGRP